MPKKKLFASITAKYGALASLDPPTLQITEKIELKRNHINIEMKRNKRDRN
jgi:hypothetical protein